MMNYFKIFAVLIFLTSCQLPGIAEKNKTKAEYHVDIALGYLRHKKNPEAIAELNQAVKLDPQNAMAHHLLGTCLYQRGRFHEAVDSYNTSLSIDPKATNVRNDLVMIYLENHKYEEAYKNALISAQDLTFPAPDQSLFLKSQAALKLAQKDRRYAKVAKRTLLATLKANPNHCGALYHLGDLYAKKQQLKKSYVLYSKSLKNCQLAQDKLKSLDALIPLSKQFGLVYQWGRYKQLKTELAKQTKSSK